MSLWGVHSLSPLTIQVTPMPFSLLSTQALLISHSVWQVYYIHNWRKVDYNRNVQTRLTTNLITVKIMLEKYCFHSSSEKVVLLLKSVF